MIFYYYYIWKKVNFIFLRYLNIVQCDYSFYYFLMSFYIKIYRNFYCNYFKKPKIFNLRINLKL